jgi:hypothetical protein
MGADIKNSVQIDEKSLYRRRYSGSFGWHGISVILFQDKTLLLKQKEAKSRRAFDKAARPVLVIDVQASSQSRPGFLGFAGELLSSHCSPASGQWI